MAPRERIREIDIAKGFGIILVVLGHSFPDANIGIANTHAKWIFDWIYSFHMPLFLTIAGYLLWEQIKKGIPLNDKYLLIKKRFSRLMIPYLFYSFGIFGIKLILTAWSRKPVGLHTIRDIVFGNSPCGNVWFLWVLFILSFLVIMSANVYGAEILGLILVVGYYFRNTVLWFETYGVKLLLEVGMWFILGVLVSKYKQKLKNIKSTSLKKIIMICVIVFIVQIIGLAIRAKTENVYWMLSSMFVSLIGVLFAYLFSLVLEKTDKGKKAIACIEWLGKESMAIYLLSYFVQTPGVTIYSKTGGMGIPYIVWVLGLMTGAILFSLLAYHLIIKKSKLLSKLMIGA